jgi:Radical SAM superfamily
MFIRPRVLSILTTRRCTAACDHCCVGAGPRAKDAIPIERIHRLIDEAKRIPTIERIVFTGGECFLLGKDLDALIAHAHELEFQTRVITNGYWAVNAEAAGTRIESLRASGLSELMLSTGTFHQSFVPVGRVVTAAKSAVLHGIPTRISVEESDQCAFSRSALANELAGELASGYLCIAGDPWITDAGGRGKTSLSHARFSAAAEPIYHGPCTQVMNVVAVTPDQMLTTCCGFPMEQLPELLIGSVADAELDDVLSKAPNRLFPMWMHVAGPEKIAAFVSRYVRDFDVVRSVSICEACTLLQRDDRVMSVIADHAAEILRAIATPFVETRGLPSSQPDEVLSCH